MTEHAAEYPDNDEIDLFRLWETIVAGKWLILGLVLLCTSAATGLAFLMTKKYEAKVIASFTEESKGGGGMSALAGQFGGLADIAGINLGAGGNKEATLAYLKSRAFIDGFLSDNALLPVLYSKLWDADKKAWKVDDPEKTPTPWKAYKLFSEKILAVNFDKKTNLVTLTITWKDRNQAVTWANELIKRANENLRQRTIEETRQSLTYLEKELQKTSVVEVQNTIYRVMESQIKTMMMANTQEQYALKVIDPAQAVDEDAFISPKRPMMIALGAISGLFVGILLVFVRNIAAKKCKK